MAAIQALPSLPLRIGLPLSVSAAMPLLTKPGLRGGCSQATWTQLPTTVSETVHVGGSRPCRTYMELSIDVGARSLPELAEALCIVFQNSYTASISVELVAERGAIAGGPRSLLPSFTLMRDANSEDDAQAWHALHGSLFMSALPPQGELLSADRANAEGPAQPLLLRIHLLQPSPNWAAFSLGGFQAFVLEGQSPAEQPEQAAARSDVAPKRRTNSARSCLLEVNEKLRALKQGVSTSDDSAIAGQAVSDIHLWKDMQAWPVLQ